MRVLLVDDDNVLRRLAFMALARVAGLDVTEADGGLRALELAAEAEFDVLVLDMMMPGMDGLTTLAKLREAGVMAPAVFLTSRVQDLDLQDYLDAGAIGTVKKPFDPMTLGQQIRDIIDDGG